MIKIQPIVQEIVLGEIEAYVALSNGYMNMSSYAHKIRPAVEALTKKQVTINGLVVALSRLKKEFKKEKPLLQEVAITNITTKLPLSEMVYENTDALVNRLESLHKKISVSREDFFTATVGTKELSIVCSSNMEKKIIGHFNTKPKFVGHNLSAIGISFKEDQLSTPNIIFSLISVVARARINIAEIVSTYTELIFIVAEKDFSKTVALFSSMHK
ncbi:MAG: hypothetical protein M3M85_01070 [bacterium]|nr:hypothetical protein [bacterium]